jgi:hypothetical protein
MARPIAAERQKYLLSLPAEKLVREIRTGKEIIPRIEILSPLDIVADNLCVAPYARRMGEKIYREGQTFSLSAAGTVNTADKFVREDIDGHHRRLGIIMVAQDRGEAPMDMRFETMYGLTRPQIWQHRIEASSAVPGVKIARLTIWIKDAWKETDWKDDCAASTAFGITYFKSSGKHKLHGEALEHVDDIRKWVTDMASWWRGNPGSLYQYLILSDITSPELMARLRTGNSFEEGQLALTIKQMVPIAQALPRRFEEQELVANFAGSQSLGDIAIRLLAYRLKGVRKISNDLLRAIVKDPDFQNAVIAAKESNPLVEALKFVTKAEKRVLLAADADPATGRLIVARLVTMHEALAKRSPRLQLLAEPIATKAEPSARACRVIQLVKPAICPDKGARAKATDALLDISLAELSPMEATAVLNAVANEFAGLQKFAGASEARIANGLRYGRELISLIEPLKGLAPEAWQNALKEMAMTALYSSDFACRGAIGAFAKDKLRPASDNGHDPLLVLS